jgi:predicted metal-dependent hydrolase
VAAEEAKRMRSTARLQGQTIKILTTPFQTEEQFRKHVSGLARQVIANAMLPAVEERVRNMNAAHFNSKLGCIRLKDNLSNWGSCSKDNNINLDFRLLFAPVPILDGVIAHELAHTKHRNHSKAFYAALLGAMPDYRERRRWLRLNGNLLNSSSVSTQPTSTAPSPAN